MTSYNPGIPTGTVKLNQDYKNIQNNFGAADGFFGVDHTKFSVNPTSPGQTGYHTTIHQIPRTNDPTPIVGIGQIYQRVTAGDTQLFFETGGGGISRLTGYNNSGSGWQYIGGNIIQWGTASIAASSPQQVAITFPNKNFLNVWSIQLSYICKNGGTGSSGATLSVIGNTVVADTGFTANIVMNDTSAFVSFYWMAIGSWT